MRNKGTLSDEVFSDLKDRILLNRIKPGMAIGEKALSEEFGVSRTPIRQALQRLEALGLVEIRDGVGTFVTSPTECDMRDAYQIRCAMELIAIETAMGNFNKAETKELLQKHLSLRGEIASGGFGVAYEEFVRADWALHDSIVEKSGNRLLPACGEEATLLLRRHQIAYIAGYLRAADEHIALIRAIEAGDLRQAKSILTVHLQVRPATDTCLMTA